MALVGAISYTSHSQTETNRVEQARWIQCRLGLPRYSRSLKAKMGPFAGYYEPGMDVSETFASTMRDIGLITNKSVSVALVHQVCGSNSLLEVR